MRLTISRTTLLAAALAILSLACTEVRSGQMPSAGERTASRALVEQIAAIASQPTSSSDLLQATAIQPVFNLLAPPRAPAAQSATLDRSGDTAGRGARDRSSRTTSLADCVISSGDAAIFSDCGRAGHMIDGTWSAQRPATVRHRVHAELADIFRVGAEDHGSLALTANLTRRPAQRTNAPRITGSPRTMLVTGTVELGITWSAGDDDYFLDVVLKVENLALPLHASREQQCATGGTMTVAGSFSDSSSNKKGDTNLNPVTLSFGPTCHDLQLTR